MGTAQPNRPSADIRRRLLAGEAITAAQCAEEYGVSLSLLGTIVKALEVDGATVVRERCDPPRRGNPHTFRVTAPEPDPALRGTWGKARGVTKLGGNGRGPNKAKGAKVPAKGAKVAALSTAPAAVVRRAVNGHAMGTEHPVPVLGESLQVFLLALTDDGRVNVGLRDGEQTWLTTVDGFSTK